MDIFKKCIGKSILKVFLDVPISKIMAIMRFSQLMSNPNVSYSRLYSLLGDQFGLPDNAGEL